MAPKVKITREEIVKAAVEIVRHQGAATVNARTVAGELNCSTQPVFSNFPTMEDLRVAVREEAMKIYGAFLRRGREDNRFPAYKSEGMSYIRFAKEETELFKLLFMRDRDGEESDTEKASFTQIATEVQQLTGLDQDAASLFHLEMWSCVHGIATMFATNYLDLEWELVSQMITHIYMGLRKQYGLEG